MKSNRLILLLILFSTLGFHPEVNAQYFGRNKVQYEDFGFQTLETPHFNIYHYPQTEEIIDEIAHLAEEWYERYSDLLNHEFNRRMPLIIYADHPDFQQTEVVSGLIDVGVGGVTEGFKTRLVMPLSETYASTDHVLGHEMAHVFQYDILTQHDTLSVETIYNIPLWMIEGMAEYLSIGPKDALTAMWMRDAVLNDKVPTISEISRDMRYSPYRYGHAVWSFITGTWGDDVIKPLFYRSAYYGFGYAINNTLDISIDSLDVLWINALKERYGPINEGRVTSKEIGFTLASYNKKAGEMNLTPVISPDGKYFIYLSEKDLFSINLYLAEVRTGKIIRKLGGNGVKHHYDAINFVQSSGTWSPDSKKVAYSVVRKGNNEIIIFDIASGKEEKTIGFEDIGAIYSLAWSPDGTKIAFAGANGGMTDLYILDLNTEELEQVTNDIYADLQPAWSADGRKIAVVTDRKANADFKETIQQNMRIAEITLDDKSIEFLPLFEDARHINPIYSTSGNSIYFISDPDGISNIYRFDKETGEIFRVTNVATGISGLTNLSPAFSVSSGTGQIIYSVFERMDYNIYALNDEHLMGETYVKVPIEESAAILVPPERIQNKVKDYLSTYTVSDEIRNSFTVKPYRPRLSLDFIGGGYAGVATSRYGTGLIGGVNLLFTDMLNQHNLFTSVIASGTVKDVAGQVFYLNKKHRFQWGGYLSHIPYVSTSTFVSRDTLQNGNGGDPVNIIDQYVFRTFEERASLIASYPVSMLNRFDFSTGYSYLHFSRELFTTTTTPDYFVIDQEKSKLDAHEPVHLANASAAFVGDNGFFGFTAPLKGYRYRFEVEGNTGTFSFMNLLLDSRFYQRLKPFTLAFRALHIGRYFGDSENEFLAPIYLGSEYLIRGYSVYSFRYSECTGDNGECPQFDRLLGSKTGLFNFEVRLPFTGYERLALIKSRFLYTSLNAFFDGGVAWWDDDQPVWDFTTTSHQRIPVFSTGLSFRINVLGAFVLEIYGAHPFQRPTRDVVFGFMINSGW